MSNVISPALSEPAANGAPIVVIVGPTCSGKSSLGVRLAQQITGEIINLDSVQVYRKLYVATAKLTPAEMGNIAHHLIDIVDPEENFTAGDYARLALPLIANIEARQHSAILVGGSGFYLRALQGQLFTEQISTDLKLRQRLKAINARRGPLHVHRLLQRLDPAAAAIIAPRDWSRSIRALEVILQTKQSITLWQQQLATPYPFTQRLRIFALSPCRAELYQRINDRVDQMFTQGLVAETAALLASGISPTAKAFGAHGYRRVIEYLQGQRDLASCIEQTKLDTRHYAKRQLTWWKHTPNVTWLAGFGDAIDPQIIIQELNKSG
jgi:tRNA dimethylallyltransferase